VEDSNYETDNRELGRGHRIKRKIQRLDSESENESDLGSQDFRVKKARTRPNNRNLSKLKKTIPVPPPVPFIASRKSVVSPHDLVRQHTPQLEKQSPKKINICKSSRNDKKNQVTKRIFNIREKMQEEKNENTVLSGKLRQLLSSKELQKPCKSKTFLHQDKEIPEHQNVDNCDLLDENQNFGVDQSFEEFVDDIELTSEKQIVFEHCPSSTDIKVLSSSSSEKNLVSKSLNELKRINPLPSLPFSVVTTSSSFNAKSHSNDNSLLQSEKSGSSCSCESKKAGKEVN